MGTYAKVQNKRLRKMLQQPVFAVLSHWVFQSIFYMDTAERLFKLGLEVILTLLAGWILAPFLHGPARWLAALAAAHTANFLFNGQLWGVLKHYGLVKTTRQGFQNYVLAFQARAKAEPSIQQVLIYGSLARGEWKESSDFDARIVRKPGFMNGVSAAFFLLRERTRALFRVFPLDVYVVDGQESKHLSCLAENAKDLLANDWRLA